MRLTKDKDIAMSASPPDRIAIDADDYHAKYVGHTRDGRQFFLTTPFEPASPGRAGCEYVALYLFDQQGRLIEAVVEAFGPRTTVDSAKMKARHDELLAGLGTVTFGRIEVVPFNIQGFGVPFGLIVREPEDEDDAWAVEVQPGNYMAFFEPWDSGEYDT